jgi:hypothetical protein
MGFVYEDEELELTVKGVVYKFRQCSAYEQKEMSNKFKNADDNTDAVDLYIDFFVSLGLPREVLEKMSLKGLLDLFGYTVGAKKN